MVVRRVTTNESSTYDSPTACSGRLVGRVLVKYILVYYIHFKHGRTDYGRYEHAFSAGVHDEVIIQEVPALVRLCMSYWKGN